MQVFYVFLIVMALLDKKDGRNGLAALNLKTGLALTRDQYAALLDADPEYLQQLTEDTRAKARDDYYDEQLKGWVDALKPVFHAENWN